MGYRELVVLDGGMGHELKSRGVHAGMDVSLEALAGCFLPGALACRDRPDAVRALHTEYVEAGARVLTTNNFVATPHYLAKTGRGGEMRELVQVLPFPKNPNYGYNMIIRELNGHDMIITFLNGNAWTMLNKPFCIDHRFRLVLILCG